MQAAGIRINKYFFYDFLPALNAPDHLPLLKGPFQEKVSSYCLTSEESFISE
jgi:hypothetical protein